MAPARSYSPQASGNKGFLDLARPTKSNKNVTGMPVVFLLTEQGWGDLAGDGEGGGHQCQRRQGEGWEVGSEASRQESGTGGRPPPLRAHGPAQTWSCREVPEPQRQDPRSQPTSVPPCQAPSRGFKPRRQLCHLFIPRL